MSKKPDHYVLGIDDDYIAEGTYATLQEAQGAADAAWVTIVRPDGYAAWKVDIEARDAEGNTLWVKTWNEDDEPYRPARVNEEAK